MSYGLESNTFDAVKRIHWNSIKIQLKKIKHRLFLEFDQIKNKAMTLGIGTVFVYSLYYRPFPQYSSSALNASEGKGLMALRNNADVRPSRPSVRPYVWVVECQQTRWASATFFPSSAETIQLCPSGRPENERAVPDSRGSSELPPISASTIAICRTSENIRLPPATFTKDQNTAQLRHSSAYGSVLPRVAFQNDNMKCSIQLFISTPGFKCIFKVSIKQR